MKQKPLFFLCAFFRSGRTKQKTRKNLSSAGPRPRISAAVDLLMKGFLGVWIGFVGLFEPTPPL
jgi:hypothetical protein